MTDVLDTPIFTFTRILEDYELHYPAHVSLSVIAKGLGGGGDVHGHVNSNDEPLAITDGEDWKRNAREWDDDVDDWPDGYDPSMDLSQQEAWNIYLANGGSWHARG